MKATFIFLFLLLLFSCQSPERKTIGKGVDTVGQQSSGTRKSVGAL